MGLEVEAIADENTGEVLDYKGFFLYVDRSSLNTIEDVSAFIADILDEQKKVNYLTTYYSFGTQLDQSHAK